MLFNSPFWADVPGDERFSVESWGIADGLPVNTLNRIEQGDEGYLWITSYEGIIRFDGHRFTVFNSTNTPEIKNNRFTEIFRHPNGNIWFLSDYGGVLKQKNGHFYFFDAENGFTNSTSNRPFLKDNDLYFPTQDGLYVYRDNSFTRLVTRNTPQGNNINNGLTAQNGLIYAASSDGIILINQNDQVSILQNPSNRHNSFNYLADFNGVLLSFGYQVINEIYEEDKIRQFNVPGYNNDTRIYYVWSDNDNLFFSTANYLFVLDSNFKVKSVRLDLIEGYIHQIQPYRDESYLMRDIFGEMLIYRDGELEYYKPTGLSQDILLIHFLADIDGNKWFTTINNGLLRLNRAIIDVIGVKEGLIHNNIISVFKDSKERLWIGSRNAGVDVLDTTNGIITNVNHLFPDLSISSSFAIAEDQNGTIWIGVDEVGLVAVRENETEVYPIGDIWGLNLIRSIVPNDDGSHWIGTKGGLVRFNEGVTEFFGRRHGLQDTRILKIKKDPLDNLWLATPNGGVFYFDGSEFTQYSSNNGLSSNTIRGIYLDKDDPEVVWFSTQGRGIARYKNGIFSVLDVTSGLFDNVVHNIVEDDYGRLWMSTNRGIFFIDKNDANQFFEGNISWVVSHSFGVRHGMRNAEANGGSQNSVFQTEDGILIYPTQDGVVFLNTHQIDKQQIEARPFIEYIVAGDKTYIQPSEIILPKRVRDITIQFTGFEFSNPEVITFEYMLAGYDKDWQHAGTLRNVRYTNLPPRNYTFKLKAINKQGVIGEDYITAEIRVQPMFYQQWWFILLMVFVGILLFYGFYRMKTRYLRNQEKRLKMEIQFRTNELEKQVDAAEIKQKIIEKQTGDLIKMNQSKDRFISIIAHDLKGPFGGFLGLIRILNDEYKNLSEAEIREYLQVVRDSSENVYKLLENLLGWARLQNKSTKPVLKDLDAEMAVYRALKIMGPIASDKAIDIVINCEKDLEVRADINMLDTVLRNIISNAIKFSFPKSIIKINTYKREQFICFEIIDKGMGMSEEDIESLFDLNTHFSRKGTSNETGTGIGLILCNEMTQAQRGKLLVESQPGHGTIFSILIPSTGKVPKAKKVAKKG